MEWIELFAKVKVIETLIGFGFLALIIVLGLGSIIVDFVTSVIRRTKRAVDARQAKERDGKSNAALRN
jgi:hypothetical protein